MEIVTQNYTPAGILQIIQANYRQQAQYDIAVQKGYDLTFKTRICEWIDVCDLVPPDELWKYLDDYFRLNQDRNSWMNVLEPEEEKTLEDLCIFIARHAGHDIITSIRLLGADCKTAAIFKTFTKRLKDRGIDTSDIRPSSKLENLVHEYGASFIEEINLLAPAVLPALTYRANRIYKWGLFLFPIFLFVTCILGNKTKWAWFTGLISIVGYAMTWIGSGLKARQANFQGIITLADLVRKISVSHHGNQISN